jgi:hypothetical protein
MEKTIGKKGNEPAGYPLCGGLTEITIEKERTRVDSTAYELGKMSGSLLGVVLSLGFAYLIATYLCRTTSLGLTWYGKAIGILLALLSAMAAEVLILPRLIGLYGLYVFYHHRLGGNTIRWKGSRLIYTLISLVMVLGVAVVPLMNQSNGTQPVTPGGISPASSGQTPSSIHPQSWWDTYRGYEDLIVPIRDAHGDIVGYDTTAADAARAEGKMDYTARTTPATTSRTVIPTPSTTRNYSSLMTQPKTTELQYKYRDFAGTIPVTTYKGPYDMYRQESHTYISNYTSEVILELLENEDQDHFLKSFLQTFSTKDPRVAISAVQHIPYDWSNRSDWKFPYETLRDNTGVCSAKSLLLAYMLRDMGYDVVLFDYSEHMAVGIRCSEEYDYQDTGYAFIETTQPTIITYVPDEYIGGYRLGSYTIIHLTTGGKSLSVRLDYADAVELKTLESMGPGLDPYHYSRWQYITGKYDIRNRT